LDHFPYPPNGRPFPEPQNHQNQITAEQDHPPDVSSYILDLGSSFCNAASDI
jgi:hypothetical protein